MRTKHMLFVACAAWIGVAQAQTETQPQTGKESEPQAGAQAGAAAANAPDDAQIAAIVAAANQAEIDTAKLAKQRAQSPAVKDFANTMIRDHTAANQKAKQLVTKLKVKPQPSETSRSLQQADRKELASLKKLKGAEFDKAYVDHEVAFHQQVLDDVNSTLLPSAKNPELKALLQKVAPGFQAHLDHAKQLQGQLSSGSASGTGSGAR